MSSELIRIIKREALQNAIDELESFIETQLENSEEKDNTKLLIEQLKRIRQNI